jgi:hypothetical protein
LWPKVAMMKTEVEEPEQQDDIKYQTDENNNFLKFLAEIIVEIIIKETSDGCNRIRKEKHKGSI